MAFGDKGTNGAARAKAGQASRDKKLADKKAAETAAGKAVIKKRNAAVEKAIADSKKLREKQAAKKTAKAEADRQEALAKKVEAKRVKTEKERKREMGPKGSPLRKKFDAKEAKILTKSTSDYNKSAEGKSNAKAVAGKATASWVQSKEGQAMLGLAMAVGLDKAGPIDRSVAAATSFMDGVQGKQKELMSIGQKLTDPKAMQSGREAVATMWSIAAFVEDSSKSMGAAISKAASSAASSAADSAESIMSEELVASAMTTAKKSSKGLFSAFKSVKAKAEEYKGQMEKKFKVNASLLDTMMDKAMSDASGAAPSAMDSLESELGDMASMSKEALKSAGIIKIEAYTRKNGDKIPTHFRKSGNQR